MQKGNGETKYFPLANYLKKQTTNRVLLTFQEIENILNFKLPNSAYTYPAWWANNTFGNSHAASWLESGFKVDTVNLGRSIEFLIAPTDNLRNNTEYVAHTSEDKRDSDGDTNHKEQKYFKLISTKMNNVNDFFREYEMVDISNLNNIELFEYMKDFRKMIGNLDNDISFLGCMLIKEYLTQRFTFNELDMGLKAQGAPGLDFDEMTKDGKRIIGELKTTYPYLDNDLGANQKNSFKKDFEKLAKNQADYKFFFVTEMKTYEIIKHKYTDYLRGVNVVLLPQAISNSNYEILDTY